MNHFNAGSLATRIANFATYEASFEHTSTSSLPVVADELIYQFTDELLQATKDLVEAGMVACAHQIGTIHKHVVKGHLHPAALTVEARNAKEGIINELIPRRFLKVALDRREFLDKEHLFGESVSAAFKSARDDIKEAGNCLAAECTTAAVFHLMRASELGLRALAYDRRVRIPKGKPIELATWEDIIKELEKAEIAIQGYPKTLAREAQYEFVHGAMMQFRAFKNVFRNQIMHTRRAYDRDRAMSIFNQVKQFMQTLAERISETTRTPKAWRGKQWTAKP